MRWMILALLWSGAAWARAPWVATGLDLARAPADRTLQLAFASELAREPVTAQEAAAVLRALLVKGKPPEDVQGPLVALLLAHGPTAGWLDLYEAAAAATVDPAVALTLRRMAAEAQEPAAGLKILERLRRAAPDRADLAVASARLLLRSGAADQVASVLIEAPATPEARQALVLATLVPGAEGDEAAWAKRLVWAGVQGGPTDVDGARAAVLGSGSSETLTMAATRPTALHRARALREAGYPELARLAAEQGPTAQAESVELTVLRGELALGAGDPATAKARFEQALVAAPGRPDAVRGLARALAASGAYDDALRVIGDQHADLVPLIHSERQVWAAAATPDRADDLPAWRGAFQSDPKSARAARLLGIALYDLGEKAEAVAPLAVAVAADPSDVDLIGRLVDAAAGHGQPMIAVRAARQGLEVAPGPVRPRLVDGLAYGWIKMAEAEKEAARIEEAEEAFAVAHALKPQDGGVLRALGGAWWSDGRTKDAWDAYLAAYSIDPLDPGGLSALVTLSIGLGRTDELRALLAPRAEAGAVRRALRELDLADELVAAQAALTAGDLDDAYARYQRLQAKDPGHPTVLRGLASIRLARGETDAALALFRQARAADPDNPWARLGEADALMIVGELDEAGARLEGLDEGGDPAFGRALRSTRARLLIAHGRKKQAAGEDQAALDDYAHALEIEPSTWACLYVGDLYAAHGQIALARAFYREAWDLDPDNVYARLGEARLLVARGGYDEAETLLSVLPQDHEDVIAAKVSLDVARALEDAEVARRIGEPEEARAYIEAVYRAHPDDPTAKGAWESERLQMGTPEERLTNARAILLEDPTHAAALGALLDAAHRLRKTSSVLPLFEHAAAQGSDKERRLLTTARLAALTERAAVLHEDGRHDDAVLLLERAMEELGEDPVNWSIIGGTWLEIRETKRAMESYDAAMLLAPGEPSPVIGKAGTYATMGRPSKGTEVLQEAWDADRHPEVGLALAEAYFDRNQQKLGEEVLAQLDEVAVTGAREPLPEIPLPSGRPVEAFEDIHSSPRLSPALEARRRDLKERGGSENAWLPGVSIGAGIYARPGFTGQQFLTAFFLPVRLHELRAGPIAFDVEAVPYLLSDAADAENGVQLSAGLQLGVGPVGLQLRGGVSPLGFRSQPYFIWYGAVDIVASQQVSLGVVTSREPVTDSLTSWAGKEDADGAFYGRVHRTGFGGYLAISPTEADEIALFGRGGWHEGLQMPDVAFWEAALSGGHDFTWDIWGLKLGAVVVGMSFSDQLDKFRVGEGGFFSPALFVNGSAKVEAGVRTRDDRFSACLGGTLGAQYIQADDPDLDPDSYIRPGVFFGYSLAAAVDWRIARYWWLGVDYGRTVTGNTWQQNVAMLHLHFGPQDAWSRHQQAVFSPLAGAPVRQAQPCGH
jgi:tetratricopeptide (TPR) repeat protein